MLNTLTWQLTDQTLTPENQIVDQGLTAYNESAAPLDQVKPLCCYARLPSGVIIGGATAKTWGQCCSLDRIWVDKAHRRQGIASKLIELLETAATDRGCTTIFLETFSFQAPTLYTHQGYQLACKFDGFPDGITKFIFKKQLQPCDSASPE